MPESISMNFRLLILHKTKVLANSNQPDDSSGVVAQTSIIKLTMAGT